MTGNQHANNPRKLLGDAAYEDFKKSLKELHKELDRKKNSKDEYNRIARQHGKQIIRLTRLEYLETRRDKWLRVPDEVQTSYRHDRNRRSVNLIPDENDKENNSKLLSGKQLGDFLKQDFSDVKTLIPCHYLLDDETGKEVTAFGHGQCFRIPYQKRIRP